jgi:hypothetical protein
MDADEVAEVPLRNTADALGHWWNALGLLRNLYASEDSFWAVAEAYEPEATFAGQYTERVRKVRNEQRLVACTAGPTNYELHIARFMGSSPLDPQGGRAAD